MKNSHRVRVPQNACSKCRINLTLSFILALTVASRAAAAQSERGTNFGQLETLSQSRAAQCEASSTPLAVREALRIVCSRKWLDTTNIAIRRAIIISFVGGFVKRDDTNHPEVLFADSLRQRYGVVVYVEVFGNHQWKEALESTIRTMGEFQEDDRLMNSVRQQTRIIIYGHSWGASQALALARELQRRNIPVALTIQIDSVRKFGQNDRTVPSNVAKAVNFYQSGGITPGQPHIVAADPARTEILGNFHIFYKHGDVNCDNYRWLSRIFNKGHHQIENDPRIWDRIELLIDSEVLEVGSDIHSTSPQLSHSK